jgi:hypothetical protein
LEIVLTQTEDTKVFYDPAMKLEFYDLVKNRLGTSIEHLDFSQSCEEFVAITNKMSVVIFSIKEPGRHEVVT